MSRIRLWRSAGGSDPAPSIDEQILAMFANGEEGAWYDTADLTTLDQKYLMTTPVTAIGQPVGLFLDKSKGLAPGSECVTNGDFTTDASGWSSVGSAVISQSNGVGVITGQTATTGGAYQDISFTAPFAQISFRWRRVQGSGAVIAQICNRGSFSNAITLTSIITDEFVTISALAPNRSGGTRVYLAAIAATPASVFEIDDVSIRELPGNHAIQATDNARPTIQTGDELVYDGVNDKLTTTFPDLGTDATIVRSIKGSGASILTGQTIGAGAWDDSTNHCGLFIIDRELTSGETAVVTQWANDRAGA